MDMGILILLSMAENKALMRVCAFIVCVHMYKAELISRARLAE